MLEIKLKKLSNNAVTPFYAKMGDAAMDLTATHKEIDLYGNVSYRTGIAIELPENYVGLIFPRSSISKMNLDLANSVGVIDSGYRGEIIIKFKPTQFYKRDKTVISAPETLSYEIGEKIAQIMIVPIPTVYFKEVNDLSSSERNVGAFGSTGK